MLVLYRILCYNCLMKHHCHCGLKKHFKLFRTKKLGALGIVLMGLHILFHVAECLVLPTIIAVLSGKNSEPVSATDAPESVILVESVPTETAFCPTDLALHSPFYLRAPYPLRSAPPCLSVLPPSSPDPDLTQY